jgi:hypothetical protein
VTADEQAAAGYVAEAAVGPFLTHEGARGAGDAVDDRDVAGEQIGELSQKQRRPQIARSDVSRSLARRGRYPAYACEQALNEIKQASSSS